MAFEDRPERRRLHEGHVGVPLLTAPVLAVLRTGGQHLAHLGVVDLEDLFVVADTGYHRMGVGDLPEVGGEALVLLGIEMSSGEEDDLVCQQRPSDGGDGLLAQWLVKVEAADLRSDGAREWGDIENDRGGDGGHDYLGTLFRSGEG